MDWKRKLTAEVERLLTGEEALAAVTLLPAGGVVPSQTEGVKLCFNWQIISDHSGPPAKRKKKNFFSFL